MPTCSRCYGEGYETYDEDGRTVTDSCYHCAETGIVDDETDRHDRLFQVAKSLAYWAEADYRHAVNDDPDGDGYNLCAYENGMMPNEWFRCRVDDRAYDMVHDLLAMPVEDQDLLLAWNDVEPEPVTAKPAEVYVPLVIEMDYEEGEIPF